MSESILDNLLDDEFKEIVSTSFSITEVTKRCGFKTCKSGGGRDRVRKRIASLNIDTSHFKPNGRQYEKPPHNKILDYKTILKKNSSTNRITVRDIVLREKLIKYECSECGNAGLWNGKELSLQLHHKDGDIMNNEVDNLTFLCPNCHSQTDNYSYKNAKRKEKKKYYCTDCGKEISKNTRNGKCKSCFAKSTVINVPTKEELLNTIKEIKFKKYICFHYSVSDKTLDKWLSIYGLPTHISELHKYINDNNL